jgi:hypothetical protein
MSRFALALAIGWLLVGVVAADSPKIDRTIIKEPVYQTKTPRYGLLVFGPEAKDRVWMVLDGETLYVDRNGNGDLTEPSEKIVAEKKAGRDPDKDGYSFEVGDLTVAGTVHKGLNVDFMPLKIYADGSVGKRSDVKAALKENPKSVVVSVSVDAEIPGMKGCGIGGRVQYSAGPIDLTGLFQFSDKPATAPVVHISGPVQITFYGELPTLRVGRDAELMLVVGTPGVGPGTFASVCYDETIPEAANPVAEFTFAPAKAGAASVKEKFEIKERC